MPNLRPTFSAVIEPAHPAMIAVHLRAFSWLAVRTVLRTDGYTLLASRQSLSRRKVSFHDLTSYRVAVGYDWSDLGVGGRETLASVPMRCERSVSMRRPRGGQRSCKPPGPCSDPSL